MPVVKGEITTSIVKLQEVVAPGTPSSGFGYLYEKSDGKIYFKGDGGTEYDLTSGSGGGLVSKTVAEMQTLASGASFTASQFYLITDADTVLYGGTNVIIQAVSSSKLAKDGTGIFYNPKYDQATPGFDIWSNWSDFQIYNISGQFQYGETITSNLGGTGVYVSGDVLSSAVDPRKAVFTVTAGTWAASTSITGGTSGATASISTINLASYSSGNVVIWGGKHWTNGTNAVGSATNDFTLDGTNWTAISFNSTDYNVVADAISYDLDNDIITTRKEIAGNNVVSFSKESIDSYFSHTFYPIKAFQWGNSFVEGDYVGIGSQTITNSYNTNINYRGQYQNYITVVEQSELSGTFDVDCWQEQLYLYEGSYQNGAILIDGSSQWFVDMIDGFQVVNFSGGSGQNSLHLRNGANQILTFTKGTTQSFTSIDNESVISGIFKFSTITKLALTNNVIINNVKATSESINGVFVSHSNLDFKNGSWSITNSNIFDKSIELSADISGESWINNSRIQPAAKLSVTAADAIDLVNTYVNYVCDSSADNVQIQAAIDALPSTGGKVVLSDGTFSLSAVITIVKSNVVLEGQGASTILKLASTINTNTITLGGGGAVSNIIVKNLQIDGNMANQTTTTNGHGIYINNDVTNAKVQDCRIVNTVKSNIYDNGGTSTFILNNYLSTTKSGGTGANITSFSAGTLIEGNTCIAGLTHNIDYEGSSNPSKAIISGNSCSGSSGKGIELAGWQIVCVGNYVASFASTGIDSSVPGEIASNTIHINSNITGYGIYTRTSDPQLITGNTVFIFTAPTQATTAMFIDGDNTTVTGNSIQFETSGTYNHIGIDSTADYVVITGNNITEYNLAGTGIRSSSGGDNLTISGNNILGFNLGINGNSIRYSSINGNVIQSGTSIDLTDAFIIQVADNVLIGNGNANSYGIFVSGTSFAIKQFSITGNIIREHKKEGIYLAATSYSTISNNVITNVGQGTNDTYSGILLKSVSTSHSTYNVINGNTITSDAGSKHKYGIREDASTDGPNIVTSNIALNAVTTQISTQHGSTVSTNNITT